jgi:glycine/D-amino acid oxidase-like deaminating enzyme
MEEHHVFIVGAGIAGCSAAYQLHKYRSKFPTGLKVSIADYREPGSLTSSASTECYRNWWTESTMLRFVGRSIELYEEIDEEAEHSFKMNRPGYCFFSGQPGSVRRYLAEAELCESLGAGPARVHHLSDLSSYVETDGLAPRTQLNGIDVLLPSPGHVLQSRLWPQLESTLLCAKHVRNCGWISVQRYLDHINAKSKESVSFLPHRVVRVVLPSNASQKVLVVLDSGKELHVNQVIFAIGPSLREMLSTALDGSMSFLSRPIPPIKLTLEIHAKVVLQDPEGVVPRGAPLMLFDDEVSLSWSPIQQAYFQTRPELHYLLKPFKGGVHFRPLGDGNKLVAIWTYNLDVENALADVPPHPHIDEYYGEIVLRGLSHFVPGLSRYIGNAENPISTANPFIEQVVTGYYCKTPENRPFIGPVWEDDPSIMWLGALSGFGIMTSPAAGQLITAHTLRHFCNDTTTLPLPDYYRTFLPSRYLDEGYVSQLELLAANSGQL